MWERNLLKVNVKATGYSLWRVPCSKCDNSQCSIAPDYGYKKIDGAQIERQLVHATARRNRLPCRNCLSWAVKLCKLLNQNLTTSVMHNVCNGKCFW